MLVEAVSGSGSNFKREDRMKALFRFFATMAIALTMGPAFFGQQRSTSEIHARINSIPTGADIKVDGAYVGTTPLEIELTCCFHDITISKRGIQSVDRQGAQQRTRKRHRTFEVTRNFASDPCGLDVSPSMPAITVSIICSRGRYQLSQDADDSAGR
jgi:hypothetical protein